MRLSCLQINYKLTNSSETERLNPCAGTAPYLIRQRICFSHSPDRFMFIYHWISMLSVNEIDGTLSVN